VTTNDDHLETRFLTTNFAENEVAVQTLPGQPQWQRRVFKLEPETLSQWAQAHVAPAPASPPGLLTYDRAALVPAVLPGGTTAVATLWRLESDPPEPFLTRLELISGGQIIHREEHVAYPASSWQRGDWFGTRMLNLIQLPADLTIPPGTTVRLSHVHVLTGRPVAQPVELSP